MSFDLAGKRRRATALGCSLLLFALNAFLCRSLFSLEFSAQMGSGESAWLTIGQWAMRHWASLTWFPDWYAGMPFHRLSPLGLPMAAAALGTVAGWTPQHAYHFLAALLYCLGPVSLFWLCYRVTGASGYALTSGLLYSLLSPTCLLFPAIRHDTSNLIEARNLSLLVRYGQGPHIAAVAMIPVFLLALHFAMVERRRWAIAVAPLILAALILTDWTAAFALVMAIGAYLLSRAGSLPTIRWGTLTGVIFIAYLLICPWFPPSTLEAIRTNIQQFDPTIWDHSTLPAIFLLDVGLLALYLGLKRLKTGWWFRFLVNYVFIAGVVVFARLWLGWHLLPRSDLLQVEFDLACCALIAYFAKMLYDRAPWPGRIVLAALTLVLCVVQTFLLARYAKEQIRPIDIANTSEYRLAKWFNSNLPDGRVYVTGSAATWMNLFSTTSQAAGCCESSVPNLQRRYAAWMIDTGQNAGAKDAELSIDWLKAYGADAIAMNATDYWKPKKFDGVLSVLWHDGDTVVYDLQRRSKSLAHAVTGPQLVSYLPEGAMDVEPFTNYLTALDAPDAPRADFRWIGNDRAHIDADLRPGDFVSVQITFDRGWRAHANGKVEPTFADGLGLLVIDPHCAGHCSIDLTWTAGRERRNMTIFQVLGLLLLLTWLFGARLWSGPIARAHPHLWKPAVLTIVSALFLILLWRTAWVAEDAYIPFRVVDNFLHGYGLRWNTSDRVQVFTDPLFLMMQLLGTAVFGHIYLTTLTLSCLLTCGGILLILRGANAMAAAFAMTALVFSKGFVDYSMSGMENPATYLAIAAYLYFYWRNRDPLLLSLMAALAATNRMDTILFFLPSLAWVYFHAGWKVWKRALAGWSPFIAWSLFSLLYYGFLFPNTAYAKLNTGIPKREVVWHGLMYYLDAWRWDTATLVVIAAGLFAACYAREWMLAAGVLLNLIYIVGVGGDYMTSRFLTAAVIFSAAILARYWGYRPAITMAVAAVIVGAGLSIPAPTITSARADFGAPWPVDPGLAVADERAYAYPCAGFLTYLRRNHGFRVTHLARPDNAWWSSCSGATTVDRTEPLFPDAYLARVGRQLKREGGVHIFGNIGMLGYFAGPEVHIIDYLALGDSLVARLPMIRGPWVPGHFPRTVPDGYLETIRTGVNRIRHPGIAEYYEHLRPVISGDLWTWTRFEEIYRFNTGYYDYLLPKAN